LVRPRSRRLCACATCHVIVDEDWADRLHPARDDEEAMLDEVPALEPASRLSCSLIWDESMDGLTVRLDGDLVRQKLEAA
jgi:ferredoxin